MIQLFGESEISQILMNNSLIFMNASFEESEIQSRTIKISVQSVSGNFYEANISTWHNSSDPKLKLFSVVLGNVSS